MTPPAPGMRSELSQVDRDRDGVIDDYELIGLRSRVVKLSSSDNMMEILSTHPNMVKRMKHVLVDGLRKLGGSSLLDLKGTLIPSLNLVSAAK